jgi:hypothetical protein
MLACWAVAHEEAPFRLSGFLRAYLVWLGCLVPGLYEVIPYTLSLYSLHPLLYYNVRRFAVCDRCQ